MQTVNIELFRNAVAFTLTLRKFNNSRRGDVRHIETDTDKARLKLSKKLLESPELEVIGKFQAELYKWCTMRSMPTFFKDGIYLVKVDQIESFEAKLNQARTQMAELVSEFQANYANQKDQARQALIGMFRDADYPAPAELPKFFSIEWNWIAFGVPENLPEELRAAEAAKIETQFRDAEAQIMAALREGFAEIISHVTDRLNVEPGEKPKIFRNTLFDELTEFIETFNARNLVNDKELGDLVTRARGILAQVRGDKAEDKASVVRDSQFAREQTAKAFTEIKQAIDSNIINKPTRKFELDK